MRKAPLYGMVLGAALFGAGEPAAMPVFPVKDVDRTLTFWREQLAVDLKKGEPVRVPASGDAATFGGTEAQTLTLAADAATGVKLLLVTGAPLSGPGDRADSPLRACVCLPEVARLRGVFPAAPHVTAGGTLYLFLTDPDGNRFCVAGPLAREIALFNGTDLTGWHLFRTGRWQVEDGVLVGEQGDNNGGGWLVTDKTYGDYTLTLSFRLSRGANSGVCLRYPGDGPPPKTGVEIQFSEVDPNYQTGSIFDVQAAPRGIYTSGWNTATIVVSGRTVTSSLNGKEVARATVERLQPKGHVALQIHGGPRYAGTSVEFKDIVLRAQE